MMSSPRPRRLIDNLVGLDRRRSRRLPDWAGGLIAWVVAPVLSLALAGGVVYVVAQCVTGSAR